MRLRQIFLVIVLLAVATLKPISVTARIESSGPTMEQSMVCVIRTNDQIATAIVSFDLVDMVNLYSRGQRAS